MTDHSDAGGMEFLWRAPIDEWEHDPVPVTTCTDALAQGVRQLRRYQSAVIWSRHSGATVGAGVEQALLFERGPGTVHVVGIGTLAAQVRSQLETGGMPGWELYKLPAQQTPVDALRPLLTTRYYGLLCRNDFATVEEIAATPDTGLLGFRNAGPKFLTAVRQASAASASLGGADVDGRVAATASERGVDMPAALDAVGQIASAAATMQAALNQLQQALQRFDTTGASL